MEDEKLSPIHVLVMIEEGSTSVCPISSHAFDKLMASEFRRADELAMDIFFAAVDESNPNYEKYAVKDVPEIPVEKSSEFVGTVGYGAWLRSQGYKVVGEWTACFF